MLIHHAAASARNALKRAVPIAWACVVVPALAADDLPVAERVLPELEPILRQAMDQSPRMVQATLDRIEAEANALVSSSRLYPDLAATFQYDLQQGDRYTSSGNEASDRFFYYLTLTQPVYHWGAIQAGARIGRLRVTAKSNDLREAYRVLAADIRGQYLQLVTSRTALRNARFDLEVRRKKLATLENQLLAGQATAGAVQGLRYSISELELTIERMDFNLGAAVRRFQQVTGMDSFEAARIPAAIPAITAVESSTTESTRMNFVEKNGFEQRPPFANTLVALEQERLAYKIARVELRPKLGVLLQASQEQLQFSGDAANRDVKSFFAGVQVRWSLFDGFAARGRARATQTRIRELRQRLESVEEDLIEAANTAAAEVGFSGRSLDFAERRYSGAQAATKAVRARQEEGRATDEDVLDAELGEKQAELQVFLARAGYLNAVSTFLAAVEADPLVNALAPETRKP